jgi:hypothetical protein
VNAPGSPGKLPLAIRNVSLACVALSAVVGFFSLSELLGLIQFSRLTQAPIQLPGSFGSEAFKRGLEAQLAAIESMRVPRALTLCALGLACALNFVSASRLIWPRGLRRETVRGLVASSSVAVALFRTLDGAQLAVVFRRVGAAMGRSADLIPELRNSSPAELEAKLRSGATVIAVLQTIAVVGAFAFFSHYFRTEKVKHLLAALDNPR